MNIEMSIFDGETKFVIDKPIRLIECFAGYGSQALALKYLGVPFEHWRISEWAIKSIQAYRDAHFPDDTKDYSENHSTAEIRAFLDGKISSDYNNPIDIKQLNRMPEKPLRTIYSNMMCTHNLGSIVGVHGKELKPREDGILNTLTTVDKDNYIACPANDTKPNFRIRKLTPKECFRLMGVKDEDSANIARNQSKSSQFHLAGDSICTTCLMAIFGEMLDMDWENKIQDVVEDITHESRID